MTIRRFSLSLPLCLLVFACTGFPLHAQTSYNFNNEEMREGPGAAADELIAPPYVPQAMQGLAPTDAQIRIQSLESQVRSLTGYAEKLQFNSQQLQAQMQRMSSDHEVRFQQLEKRLIEMEAAAKAAQAAPPPAEAENKEAEKEEPAVDAPATTPEGKTLGTIPRGEKGTSAEDPQKLYDAAFMALRQAHYEDAESKFKAFLKANPKHKLTENAKYWLAETYYVRGKYSEAAVAFADTYQKYPQGSKAPDNLLKMAMSLGALGKKQDACLTLGELKKRFPAASSIIRNRSEQEKKTLGCA